MFVRGGGGSLMRFSQSREWRAGTERNQPARHAINPRLAGRGALRCSKIDYEAMPAMSSSETFGGQAFGEWLSP